MIKRQKPPNKYSLKKIDEINAEAPIRIALCYRAGGRPLIYMQKYRRNDGKVYTIKRVRCVGGKCECGCKKPANAINGNLEPHEQLTRGRGGKLSLRNTKMVLRECHRKLQNREPRLSWVK